MQRLLFIALTLLLLQPGTSQAAERTPIGLNDVIRTLESPFRADAAPQEAIYDFSADFFQESHLASLDKSQRGRGRVSVKFSRNFTGRAPLALFRWEYTQPTNQEIVSDGNTLWVYLPENRQVIQSELGSVTRADANNPLTFLTGLGNLSRDFSIGYAVPNQDAQGNYILDLRPRRSSPMIRQLFIVVNRDAVLARVQQNPDPRYFPMLSTTVIDPNDNRTVLEFSDFRVNRGLSDFDFRFVMPPGVEVVRPTGSEMGF